MNRPAFTKSGRVQRCNNDTLAKSCRSHRARRRRARVFGIPLAMAKIKTNGTKGMQVSGQEARGERGLKRQRRARTSSPATHVTHTVRANCPLRRRRHSRIWIRSSISRSGEAGEQEGRADEGGMVWLCRPSTTPPGGQWSRRLICRGAEAMEGSPEHERTEVWPVEKPVLRTPATPV